MIEFKKGLYYQAHPYTCKDEHGLYVAGGEEANFRLCNYRAAKLIEMGYLIYSPISHTHPIHMAYPPFVGQNVHEMWYEFDVANIRAIPFEGIILCPKWETSRGCKLERTLFLELGRQVILYDDIVKNETI